MLKIFWIKFKPDLTIMKSSPGCSKMCIYKKIMVKYALKKYILLSRSKQEV